MPGMSYISCRGGKSNILLKRSLSDTPLPASRVGPKPSLQTPLHRSSKTCPVYHKLEKVVSFSIPISGLVNLHVKSPSFPQLSLARWICNANSWSCDLGRLNQIRSKVCIFTPRNSNSSAER